MHRNIDSEERIIRVIGGLGIITLAFWGPETVWVWLGLIPLVTGLAGTYPLYSIFGLSTCEIRIRETKK